MATPATMHIECANPAPVPNDGFALTNLELLSGSQRRTGFLVSALRTMGLATGHATIFLAAYIAAFALRFDFAIPAEWQPVFWANLPWIVGLKLVVFSGMGQFYGWWRYVTMADLAALLRAMTISFIAILIADRFLVTAHVPRSILIFDFVLSIVCLGAFRASWRLVRELGWQTLGKGGRRGALLVGSDDSAAVLAHQMHALPESPYRITGILDIDPMRSGRRLGCLPILGTPDDAEAIARSHGISDVFGVAGSLPGRPLRKLMESCVRSRLTLKIIPPAEELFRGQATVPTRAIEINDLLRRDPVQLDAASIGAMLKGKTVLVTGAGGSIGSEICRQVLKFEPATLVLLGRGENRIFFIERELQAQRTVTRLVPRIADITDEPRIRRIFEEFRPDVVFHAAAHKHVPLMELNAGEAVKNNVLGTRCLADCADEFGAECFVLISSDKAVNPANVMGATKNLAERYVMALAERSETRFIATRFGNVLGSAGSVVPLFQEQIRRGGPITITDARMTRYFMTIPEASQLVLQAAAIGNGREIFVLDMGEPVKIVDLARDMIRLSGLPENSIEIICTGIRRGEKLYEELYFDDEETAATSHKKLRIVYHRTEDYPDIRDAVADLGEIADGPSELVLERIRELVPEYLPFGEAQDAGEDAPKPSRTSERRADRQHVAL
jgi:FlaA1/EpsC-like NDP-sugar epimerase